MNGTIGLIYEKMNLVMKEVKSVGKDSINPSQNYKFRGIDAFINALHPCLCKHGVFMTGSCTSKTETIKEVVRSNGKPGVDKHVSIIMEYTFHAADGSKVSCAFPAEGVDSGDKATNKALSAALKYCLIQTFCVPTEDMVDGDFESPELGSEKRIEVKPKATVVKQEAPKEDNAQTKAIMEGGDKPVEVAKKAKPSFNKKTTVKAETNEEEW